eukprot:gene20892-biopygen16147
MRDTRPAPRNAPGPRPPPRNEQGTAGPDTERARTPGPRHGTLQEPRPPPKNAPGPPAPATEQARNTPWPQPGLNRKAVVLQVCSHPFDGSLISSVVHGQHLRAIL